MLGKYCKIEKLKQGEINVEVADDWFLDIAGCIY